MGGREALFPPGIDGQVACATAIGSSKAEAFAPAAGAWNHYDDRTMAPSWKRTGEFTRLTETLIGSGFAQKNHSA